MKSERTVQASIAWTLFWGAVAVDSAVAHKRSEEAIQRAVDADPVQELYDGPPDQPAQVKRWLFWREPTLTRLRELNRSTRMWTIGAPIIALAGPPILIALGAWLSGARSDDVRATGARRA